MTSIESFPASMRTEVITAVVESGAMPALSVYYFGEKGFELPLTYPTIVLSGSGQSGYRSRGKSGGTHVDASGITRH
jgi:hypothetical protein